MDITRDLQEEPVLDERVIAEEAEADATLVGALERVAVHLDHLVGGVLVLAVLLAAILVAIVFHIRI